MARVKGGTRQTLPALCAIFQKEHVHPQYCVGETNNHGSQQGVEPTEGFEPSTLETKTDALVVYGVTCKSYKGTR